MIIFGDYYFTCHSHLGVSPWHIDSSTCSEKPPWNISNGPWLFSSQNPNAISESFSTLFSTQPIHRSEWSCMRKPLGYSEVFCSLRSCLGMAHSRLLWFQRQLIVANLYILFGGRFPFCQIRIGFLIFFFNWGLDLGGLYHQARSPIFLFCFVFAFFETGSH